MRDRLKTQTPVDRKAVVEALRSLQELLREVDTQDPGGPPAATQTPVTEPSPPQAAPEDPPPADALPAQEDELEATLDDDPLIMWFDKPGGEATQKSMADITAARQPRGESALELGGDPAGRGIPILEDVAEPTASLTGTPPPEFAAGDIVELADQSVARIEKALHERTGQSLDSATRGRILKEIFAALQDWAADTERRLREEAQ